MLLGKERTIKDQVSRRQNMMNEVSFKFLNILICRKAERIQECFIFLRDFYFKTFSTKEEIKVKQTDQYKEKTQFE